MRLKSRTQGGNARFFSRLKISLEDTIFLCIFRDFQRSIDHETCFSDLVKKRGAKFGPDLVLYIFIYIHNIRPRNKYSYHSNLFRFEYAGLMV